MSFRGNPNAVNMTDDQDIGGVKAFNNDVIVENISDFSPNFILVAHNSGRQSRLVETSNGFAVYEGVSTNLDKIYAGASDTNNTVVTTIGKNKASTGYFKFGNGLILQWGLVSGTGGTVTLATPFSSTNYGVSMTRISNNGTNNNDAITAVTSTNFTAAIPQGGGAHWLAIGY